MPLGVRRSVPRHLRVLRVTLPSLWLGGYTDHTPNPGDCPHGRVVALGTPAATDTGPTRPGHACPLQPTTSLPVGPAVPSKCLGFRVRTEELDQAHDLWIRSERRTLQGPVYAPPAGPAAPPPVRGRHSERHCAGSTNVCSASNAMHSAWHRSPEGAPLLPGAHCPATEPSMNPGVSDTRWLSAAEARTCCRWGCGRCLGRVLPGAPP